MKVSLRRPILSVLLTLAGKPASLIDLPFVLHFGMNDTGCKESVRQVNAKISAINDRSFRAVV